jgi:hypothetical protein
VTQDFTAPMLDGSRLDLCLLWGEQCGQPAADAFCRDQGFDQASAWAPAENIGATEPTVVMTSRAVCSHPDCDGFESITCTRPASAPADYARRLPPAAAPEASPLPPADVAEPAPEPTEPEPTEPPSDAPAVEVAALEPWTTQDVIDPRIDVQAQYALMRMFRGDDSLEQTIASHVLTAIKSGELGGIYQENQQAAALRAQSVGYGWWQILPPAAQQPRVDGICMTEPADRPPILVMRREAEKNPAAYDEAMQDAWYACGLPATPVRSYVTTLPDKEPEPTLTECPLPSSQSTLTVKVITEEDWPPPSVSLLSEGQPVDHQMTDDGGVVEFFPPGEGFYVVSATQGAISGVWSGTSNVYVLDQCRHSRVVVLKPPIPYD